MSAVAATRLAASGKQVQRRTQLQVQFVSINKEPAQMNPWQARRLEADSDKALGIYQILKHPKYIFG